MQGRELRLAITLILLVINCWTTSLHSWPGHQRYCATMQAASEHCGGSRRPFEVHGNLRRDGGVGFMALRGGGSVIQCLPFCSEEESINGHLIRAAKRGKIDQIQRLVRQGAYVNCSNDRGQSPLIKASERGHTDAVLQLLKLGADIGFVDRHKSTALHYAAWNGHTSTVEVLSAKGPDWLHAGNKFGYTPLHYAAADGHTQTVAALVSLGADVHHIDRSDLTALHRAAAGGHVSAVVELVKLGACINGSRPLGRLTAPIPRETSAQNAAGIRGVACLDLLVSPAPEQHHNMSSSTLGAQEKTHGGEEAGDGSGAADALALSETSEISERALCVSERGVGEMVRQDGQHAAAAPASAEENNGDAVCMLYARQEEGSMLYTPLHEAAWCNQLSSAKTLVSLGASVLAKDKWGKTPLDLARAQMGDASEGSQHVFDFLQHIAVREERMLQKKANQNTNTSSGEGVAERWGRACLFEGAGGDGGRDECGEKEGVEEETLSTEHVGNVHIGRAGSWDLRTVSPQSLCISQSMHDW